MRPPAAIVPLRRRLCTAAVLALATGACGWRTARAAEAGADTDAEGNAAARFPQADGAPARPPSAALVIGNARYGVAANALRNPVHDARLITDAFRRHGVDATQRADLTTAQMRDALRQFAQRSQGQALAVFYFAGHAVSVDGVNYLFGVDLPVPLDALTISAAQRHGLSLQTVTQALRRAGVQARILVVDACRTPLTRGQATTGLARSVPAGGELIAYSTQPGASAEDGFGTAGPAHSPYAYYFARQLDALNPQAPVETLFKQLTADVQVATAYRQVPHYESSLVGQVRLAGLEDGRTTASPPSRDGRADRPRGAAPSLGRDLIEARMNGWEQEIMHGAQTVDAPRHQALRARAEAGDVVAMATLGQIAEAGTHGPRDDARAVGWYRLAAARGFAPAQTYLGEMIAMGRGAPKDYAQAERLFQDAAAAGHARASLDLIDVRARMGQPVDPKDLMSVLEQSIRAMQQGAAGAAR